MKTKTLFFLAGTLLFGSTVFAQRFGNTPEDSTNCIINNSLYQTSYNQKNYKDAYEPWKKALQYCPQYNENLYIRGINILKNLIADASDAATQKKYLDELFSLYDKRIAAFGDTATNLARKANDMATYFPKQQKEVYEMYLKAVEVGQDNMDDQYKPLYLRATLDYLVAIKANTEQMSILFDAYDYASESLERSLAKATKEKDKKKIEGYIAITEQIIEPFATCEKLLEIYQPKYENFPKDTAVLSKIMNNMARKGCTDSDLFFNVTEALHAQKPTAVTAISMGRMCLAKKNYNRAVDYFNEAIEKYDNVADKAKASYALAQSLYAAGQYAAGRTAANKAMSLDNSYAGKATLLIARMYLASSASCATGGGEIRGAAWAAYDKASKAKSLDANIADEAQQVMNACVGQWPTKDNAFFHNLSNGDSYHVGCWIGESTTVRTR